MAKKLLDQLREVLRLKHYSYRTEEAYLGWVRRFILFHKKRHPAEMGAPEIRAFLAHLARDGHISASTQNQALSAILFLYREVLHKEAAAWPCAARWTKASPTRARLERAGALGRAPLPDHLRLARPTVIPPNTTVTMAAASSPNPSTVPVLDGG
jgi:hypothetical protein